MSKRPRRNHSPLFKAKVAVDAIKGEKTLAELAKLHDVWRPTLTSGLPIGLEFDGPAGSDRKLLALGLAVEGVLGRLPAPTK